MCKAPCKGKECLTRYKTESADRASPDFYGYSLEREMVLQTVKSCQCSISSSIGVVLRFFEVDRSNLYALGLEDCRNRLGGNGKQAAKRCVAFTWGYTSSKLVWTLQLA